jgi:hypothetical protein
MLLHTANTNVLVNGVPRDRIYHMRGLRQGDPTAPHDLCGVHGDPYGYNEEGVLENLFDNLASMSPLHRISVYADDVVLFLKTESQELWAVRHILSLFGEASGLQVNYRKTTATLIRGSEEQEERTTRIIGCELAKFPIKYLGMQLALRPLTTAEWQPLLDQVVKSVPTWQRGLIRREGRLVLINSVVAARAVH